jgi:hypothetical protein
MVGDAVTRRGRPKQRNVEIVFMVGVAYEAADESKNYRVFQQGRFALFICVARSRLDRNRTGRLVHRISCFSGRE